MEIQSDWWKEFFGSEAWAEVHGKSKSLELTLREVDFIEAIYKQRPGLKILDIPCGIGRHAIQLAKRGHVVTGVDISENLLTLARKNAAENNVPLNLIRGDMRTWTSADQYDAVLCLWGSLGYFDDAETMEYFKRCYQSLKTGGAFIIDQPVLETFLRGGFSANQWSEKNNLFVLESVNWNAETGRNESEWVFIGEQGIHRFRSSIRLYLYRELIQLLKQAGFVKFDAYGTLDFKPFAIGDRLYLVAWKD